MIFVLTGGLLWSIQPVFLLIFGQRYQETNSVFVLLNHVGIVAVVGTTAFFTANRKRVAAAFRSRADKWSFLLTTVADGLLVSIAFIALAKSARGGDLVTAAVIFEAWPIIATAMLSWFSKKRDDRNWASRLALVLFCAGFLIINLTDIRILLQFGEFSDTLLPVVSSLSMGLTVVVVQVYIRRRASFSRMREFSVFLTVRALAATLFIGLYCLVEAAPGRLEFSVEFVSASLLIGVLVSLNSFFFHIGARNISGNVGTLAALIAPVLAPVIIYMLGYGHLHTNLLVGSAGIFAGIALTSRGKDINGQFLLILLAIAAFGHVVIFIPGRGAPHYWAYIQTISVFFGLLQASAITRLSNRFERLISLRSICAHDAGSSNAARAELMALKRESTSISELLLLSIVALASIIITLYSRENSFEGDSIAYIICVTISYMMVICWVLQKRIMHFDLDPLSDLAQQRGRMPGRVLSYALIVLMFVWFLSIIWSVPR
ncbi:hypothetical protein [Limimaricola pyoseonensis]|uniref:hypothetical protein n=1 Tax=Limimaricola pyoseonensis TaxID=521013 RepID=UPI000B7E6E6D|nr:hypothetical protein [Limimaricola pyoseonensis]